ncbi:hypothetical protein LR48_Vigan10g056100 [Vigna angularis]|uniref:Trypsin inhibitor DE-3 n=1 Tax=Phaseolus angularis TaxID=3914 RepID=A0A0L9VIW8_PHAAN|nr:kunitz-type trypsin inhibitor-like 1 protein [Vigna angularis]KAG2384933.1 Trypsin inhibitor DE-3 [Vigna angularis]KOM54669.1 hypothetical protein LR48_Vigan10g056100 [Vigna angularis]
MKSAPLLTLSFFFLFAITTINLTLSFAAPSEKVVDSQQSPVSSTAKYFILPFFSGPEGGGVALGLAGNSTCPVTVLQTPDESNHGQAVTFSQQGTSSGAIFTQKSLNIAFVDKPSCASSSKWVVVSDDFPEKWVGIGGARDHPGKKILTGTFNIQRFDAGYKLVFCASSNTCFSIGRHNDVKGRRLVLSNRPFQVSFNKE